MDLTNLNMINELLEKANESYAKRKIEVLEIPYYYLAFTEDEIKALYQHCYNNGYIFLINDGTNKIELHRVITNRGEQKMILTKSIEKDGRGMQYILMVEEAAELVKEITKTIRCLGDRNHIAEEMADVLIMIKKLSIIHGAELMEHMEKPSVTVTEFIQDLNRLGEESAAYMYNDHEADERLIMLLENCYGSLLAWQTQHQLKGLVEVFYNKKIQRIQELYN